jgi:hypothetical protein
MINLPMRIGGQARRAARRFVAAEYDPAYLPYADRGSAKARTTAWPFPELSRCAKGFAPAFTDLMLVVDG